MIAWAWSARERAFLESVKDPIKNRTFTTAIVDTFFMKTTFPIRSYSHLASHPPKMISLKNIGEISLVKWFIFSIEGKQNNEEENLKNDKGG